MASVKIPQSPVRPLDVDPTEVYGTSGPIKLRIATGGAGQSGLLRALCEKFIEDHLSSSNSTFPFRIAWLASDTSASFNHLASAAADVSITYHPGAEAIAVAQGFVSRVEYAWRDHWMLVGPKSNPANLPTSGSSTTSIYTLFALLFRSAISTAGGPHAVKFLSRHDKSAANIAESRIWATIGQTPWADPPSPWYHRYVDFPFQALRAASKLGEYTLVDRGTWWSVEAGVREGMVVFMEGRDEDGSTTEGNVMINPAHILLGKQGRDGQMGREFVEWMVKREGGGGQRVIEGFERGGKRLYTVAPAERVDALGAVGGMLGGGLGEGRGRGGEVG